MWKDAKHGILFPITNLPYGARLIEKGKTIFTNEPHLLIAIDVSDFDRTNIISDLGSVKLLKLTNAIIFRKDNGVISDTKSMLTLPIGQTMSKLRQYRRKPKHLFAKTRSV